MSQSMKDSYSDLLQLLYRCDRKLGIKLGLTTMQTLDKHLGHPSLQYAVVHVGGTNGKGSTVTKVARTLQHAGYRVGLYTSPHISSFRERIDVDGVPITEEAVEALLPEIIATAEALQLSPTFFEYATLLAFQYFAKREIDIAVVEVGLGGRLDATNIVTPVISAITSIGYDHCDLLGDTLDAIACEKAGIIKPYVPVVLGPTVPPIVADIAGERGARVYPVAPTAGWYDKENVAIATNVLDAIQDAWPTSTESRAYGLRCRPPCRLEIIPGKDIVLDVGHNPQGITRLVEAMSMEFPGRSYRVVAGFSKNKDVESCLKILCQRTKHLYCVESDNGRGIAKERLASMAMGLPHPQKTYLFGTIEDAVKEAWVASQAHHEMLLVCGTFFIMRQVLDVCRGQEVRSAMTCHRF